MVLKEYCQVPVEKAYFLHIVRLEPLLFEIKRNRKTLVNSFIDTMSKIGKLYSVLRIDALFGMLLDTLNSNQVIIFQIQTRCGVIGKVDSCCPCFLR